VRKHRPKSKSERKKIIQEWHRPSKPRTCSIEPIITWIGHATFLIQIDGINIVTDPIFFDLSYFFPRIAPPGIAIKNLPPIDVLLISHDHRDHMEKKSLQQLSSHNPIVLAPEGLGKRLSKRGFKKIEENNWGRKFTISTKSNKEIIFTFLPAEHWSGCNIFNIGKSKYGSWMIEHNTHTIYFAGDTSYAGHFCEIGKDYPKIKTSLLPIGPIEPRHLINNAHLDARQAVRAFIDLKSKQFIPMHWGTFQLGAESFKEPINQLQAEWDKKISNPDEKKLILLKFGAPKKLSLNSFW
jgi:L-ascorbate metabolism protein UlaG (beta-lactamase superfamily)